MNRSNHISKNTYIASLPKETQEIIELSIRIALIKQGITDANELKEALENAMSSRICDIEDVVDIFVHLPETC